MPLEKKEMTRQKQFLKVYLDTYNEYSNKMASKITEKMHMEIFKRCLRIFYRSPKTYTYSIPVTPKVVPLDLIIDGLGPLTE
jgi:hypothetical protein